MTRRAGRNARLYVDLSDAGDGAASPVTFLSEVSMDFSTDKHDVTAFGDENKVSVAGLPGAGGRYSGWYDDATDQLFDMAQDGIARKFYWYPDRSNDEGTYFFGEAHFDFSLSTPVAGAAAISGSFEAASAVSKVQAA